MAVKKKRFNKITEKDKNIAATNETVAGNQQDEVRSIVIKRHSMLWYQYSYNLLNKNNKANESCCPFTNTKDINGIIKLAL